MQYFHYMHFRDTPNLGLWYTDFLSGETSWSPEMFVIYGLDPNSLFPSVEILMKHTHPLDRDNVSHAIHLATKTTRPFSFFYRITRRDKATRNLFSAGGFELNERGSPINRYGICLNLTGLTTEEASDAIGKLKEFELPARASLSVLDSSLSQIGLLREIAATVTERMQSKLLRGHQVK